MWIRLAVLMVYALPLAADSYTFIKLAETGPNSEYSTVAAFALSGNGIAVLSVIRKDTTAGVYTTSDGNLTKTYDAQQALRAGVIGSLPTGVNSSGTVALNGTLENFSYGAFTAAAGVLSPLLKTSDPSGGEVFLNDFSEASFVLNSGAAGLRRSAKVVVSSSGALKTIAEQTGEFAGLLFTGAPINNKGRVVFLAADLFSQKGGLYIGGDVPVTKIMSLSNESRITVSTGFAINDAGAVAVGSDTGGTLETRITVLEAGVARRIVTSTPIPGAGPFRSVSTPTINNAGTVAFIGYGHPGFPNVGIYTGPDAVNDRVIAVGDPLFGSIIEDVHRSLGGSSLVRYIDDQGRILIYYKVSVRPTPVEPPRQSC